MLNILHGTIDEEVIASAMYEKYQSVIPKDYQRCFLNSFKNGILCADKRDDAAYYRFLSDFESGWDFFNDDYYSKVYEKNKNARKLFDQLSRDPAFVEVIPQYVYYHLSPKDDK